MIMPTDLARQLRAEIERSTAALRHVADMLDALDVSAPVMIEMPYRSQHDPDAQLSRSDCGPACIAMLLQWRSVQVAIDEISRETGLGTTNAGHLIVSAERRGLKLTRLKGMTLDDLERLIQAGEPLVALVRYSHFGSQRQDLNYPGLHWVVVLGYDGGNVYIHDPDYWGERRIEGMRKPISRSVFSHAWDDTMPDAFSRQALVLARGKDATQGR